MSRFAAGPDRRRREAEICLVCSAGARDGGERAYRARTRPPSYIHFSVFPYLIKGHQISDVVAVLGSLNIIAAELDR